MKTYPARSCKYPRCPQYSNDGTGYCPLHVHLYVPFVRRPDKRPLSARSVYGAAWRKIRERVLIEHGIPREYWPLYDVDHNPPYNPEREPDHNKYLLIPRLHADHSRKTARENGGWGNAIITNRWHGDSLITKKYNRAVVSVAHTGRIEPRGCA